jgi:hypothetical protein
MESSLLRLVVYFFTPWLITLLGVTTHPNDNETSFQVVTFLDIISKIPSPYSKQVIP